MIEPTKGKNMGRCRFFKKGNCTRFGEKDICRFDWGADTCYYFRQVDWRLPVGASSLAEKRDPREGKCSMWMGQSENFLHDGIEENLMKKNSKKQELIPLAIVLIICFIIMIQMAFLVINWFCGLL